MSCPTSYISAEHCCAVPVQGPNICKICHGFAAGRHSLCLSCSKIQLRLGHSLTRVIPMTLSAPRLDGRAPSTARSSVSELYNVLRCYKWELPEERLLYNRVRLASLLVAYLSLHSSCIAQEFGKLWDLIAIVPSSKGRKNTHPLQQVLQHFELIGSKFSPIVEAGTEHLNHNMASRDGFKATIETRAIRPCKILLIDDTYVTGARAQSAASCLGNCGFNVMAIIAFTRVVNPSFSKGHGDYWRRCYEIRPQLERCCLES